MVTRCAAAGGPTISVNTSRTPTICAHADTANATIARNAVDDEAKGYAFGFRQFRLQACEDQRPHDGGQRGQRYCAEHGQGRDHGVVDRQYVTEQERSRLRSERRVIVQKQEAEPERQREDDADCDVAVADALA